MTDVPVLPSDRLAAIAEIDRSEHIDTLYEAHCGALTSRSVSIDVPRWDPVGDGPHSAGRLIDFVRPIVARGGTLLGAFDGDGVAGVAVVEERFDGDMAWLAFLHVDRGYRRRGIGTALWFEAVDRARAAEARSMYVSATPSGSAVGFYLARGCEVLAVPHPELFAEEPEDVHLLAAIDGPSG